MTPDLARVTSPEYLAQLTSRPIEDVRAMRAECQAFENAMSYVRRLAQGRLDIVAAELERRRGGGDPADLSTLVAALPGILADRPRGVAPVRAPSEVSVERLADSMVARLDTIVGAGNLTDLSAHDDGDLVAMREALSDVEGSLSADRRALHDVIDALQAELTRRYRTGEASVDSLLQ
jgi:hypothetical protein